MNPQEWRSTALLSAINVLRNLGMLMILPVFALYARQQLPGGATPEQVGLAIGASSGVQALLLLPFGILSDRYGRKPLILIGTAMFVVGSLIAALAHGINGITFGRAVQGSGAIASVLSALLSDSTRIEARTQAMALFGACTALSFVFAIVVGPILEGWVGVPGIFMLTAIAGFLSLPLIAFGVKAPPLGAPAEAGIGQVLVDPFLVRLNGGAFLINFMLTGLFAGIPFAIESTLGLHTGTQWKAYLPVLVGALLLTLPLIRRSRASANPKPLFLIMILLLGGSMALLALDYRQKAGVIVAMLAFFVPFCFLGATMPASVSKRVSPAQRGAALGVFTTAQYLGAALGNIGCNWLRGKTEIVGVFIALAIVPLIWMLFAVGQSMDSPIEPAEPLPAP